MITAVCGGKGGTGKSTYAILLAKRTGALLVDTDVENPSLHLLLNVELGREVAKAYVKKPRLVKEKCRKCGLCAKHCRFNAIFAPSGRYPLFLQDLCEGCNVCSVVCPYGAIEMVPVEAGRVYYNEDAGLVTGKGEEARVVVSEVLKFAKGLGRDMVVDCPAGIHCNVLPQMLEADRIIIVTEPTPLGISGLEAALETLQKIGKKADVVVNKFEENESYREIEDLAKRFGAGITERLPYSEEIAKAYAQGKLLEVLK